MRYSSSHKFAGIDLRKSIFLCFIFSKLCTEVKRKFKNIYLFHEELDVRIVQELVMQQLPNLKNKKFQ